MPLANYSTPPGYDSVSIGSYRLFGRTECLHILDANTLRSRGKLEGASRCCKSISVSIYGPVFCQMWCPRNG